MSNESEQILGIIRKFGPIRSSDIVKKLGVSTKTVYKHLGRLLDEGLIIKEGATPKVYYFLKEPDHLHMPVESLDDFLIESNYIYVSPDGRISRGLIGFSEWCVKNSMDLEKEKKIFLQRLKTIQKIKKDGLISAKKKILSNGRDLCLDDVFFSDFYTFDHLGKTKLGQLVYLGKASQSKELIGEIARIIEPSLRKMVEKKSIKNICFIPPTIDRKIQFLDVLRKKLNIGLNEIKAVKIASATKIPQKTLRKLEDRVLNAKNTIVVPINQEIKGNVLLIDDATGSGATLNETARKIRAIAGGKIKIYGYSVVGSYKGFDVISEV